jgi:hypothetical protein
MAPRSRHFIHWRQSHFTIINDENEAVHCPEVNHWKTPRKSIGMNAACESTPVLKSQGAKTCR